MHDLLLQYPMLFWGALASLVLQVALSIARKGHPIAQVAATIFLGLLTAAGLWLMGLGLYAAGVPVAAVSFVHLCMAGTIAWGLIEVFAAVFRSL